MQLKDNWNLLTDCHSFRDKFRFEVILEVVQEQQQVSLISLCKDLFSAILWAMFKIYRNDAVGGFSPV